MGGMAELYLAYLPGPGGFKKFVALKQILPDVKRDESFVKMFLDEARITAAFSHSNIGQVFDLGEDGGELYLAMEFIAGQNLEQVVKRAAKRELPIPVGFAARVIRDTALGLHYAHTFREPSTGAPMPVVHRDVSPKNVMITYQGQVKVIDFGIAKARGRLNRTQVGIVKGTSGYMAPEQVKNEPLDGRVDLFASAVMLHELLAGERLFTGPSDAAMMIKIVEGEAQPPTQVNPYVTPELEAAVLKGLEKQKDQRWATGKEFARAIEASCPELFDDEQLGEYMTQLFDDKIALTRSLIELANEGMSESVSKAVEALSSQEPEPTPAPRRKVTQGAGAPSKATPGPRPGLSKAGASSQRLPRVATGQNPRTPSRQDLQRVPAVPKSSRSLPRVTDDDETGRKSDPRRRASPPPDETIPPGKRSNRSLPPVAQPEPEPAPAPEPEAPRSSGLGAALAVLVVVMVAVLGWAAFFGPLRERTRALLATETEAPVDTGPRPLKLEPPKGQSEKPAWLLEREKKAAELADEKARQKEIEDAANDPERARALAEIQSQLQSIDRLEEEQRQLKIEAKQGKTDTAQNAKKIDDLQKQIDDMKSLLQKKNAGAAAKKGEKVEEGVQVVNDKASARAAGVGYLTVRTINPSSAAVFDGDTSLGSTPLVKMPLDVGAHQLRVVDGESKLRLLSVSIEAGKTLEIKAVDVATLPAAP
jgi:serine/threonine-protein kinase